MKKILLMFLFTIGSVCAEAQTDAISRFFGKYMDDERFTSVYVSGKMFNMFAKLSEGQDEKEFRETISKLAGLRILSSEQVDGYKMYKEFGSNLASKGYEELMFIKEGGKPEMQILIKETNGKIAELLMLSGSGKSFFLLSIIGDIDLNQISKLSESMDIQGMDNLKNVKDPKKPQKKN